MDFLSLELFARMKHRAEKYLKALYLSREERYATWREKGHEPASHDSEWAIETWRLLPYLAGCDDEDAFLEETVDIVPVLIAQGLVEGIPKGGILQGYYFALRFTKTGLERAVQLQG